MDVTQRVPTAILFPEDLSLTTKFLDFASRKAEQGGLGNWLISRGAVVATIFTAAIDALSHAAAGVVKALVWVIATPLWLLTLRRHDLAPGANLWAISAHTARALTYAILTVGAPLAGLFSPTKTAEFVRSTLLSANAAAPAAPADEENPQESVVASHHSAVSHHSVAAQLSVAQASLKASVIAEQLPTEPSTITVGKVSVVTEPPTDVFTKLEPLPLILPVVDNKPIYKQPVAVAQPAKCRSWKACLSEVPSKAGTVCRNVLNYAKAHPVKAAAGGALLVAAAYDGLSFIKGFVPYTEWTSSLPISKCLANNVIYYGYSFGCGIGEFVQWSSAKVGYNWTAEACDREKWAGYFA